MYSLFKTETREFLLAAIFQGMLFEDTSTLTQGGRKEKQTALSLSNNMR